MTLLKKIELVDCKKESPMNGLHLSSQMPVPHFLSRAEDDGMSRNWPHRKELSTGAESQSQSKGEQASQKAEWKSLWES